MRKQRGKLLCATALLGGLPFSPAPSAAQTSRGPSNAAMERDFQAAMAAEDRGDSQQAETLLSRLHAEHPGIFAVDESLGLLLASRGELSKALPLLQAAVREQPSSDAAHANLGAALYQDHRIPPAIGQFEQAVRINPGNFSAQQGLGRLWMESHNAAEAALAFTAALALKPGDAALKLDCVTALLAANRIDSAREMLSTLANADRSARAQSLLGEADERQSQFESAARHFALAAQLEPSEENAWQLGYEYLRHWTFAPAIAEFEAASLKFPASKRIRLGLGAALFGDAQYLRAVPVFADLLAAEPDSSMAAQMLGISCNAAMQTINPRCEALTVYARTHPADAVAATYAATWLMTEPGNQQHVELARGLLQSAMAANPNLPEAQFQMGVILENDANWKASIPYLEAAVRLKPDFAQAHYRLARAYWKTGRKREGQEQMDLQKKFASQDNKDLDLRLRQIYRFAVNSR